MMMNLNYRLFFVLIIFSISVVKGQVVNFTNDECIKPITTIIKVCG